MTISGGEVGRGFDALSGSQVTISGGTVGNFFDAFDGSQVTISGGTVGDFFNAFSGSQVTISGGAVGESFDAFSGSEVNLIGSEFFLDGSELEGLIAGETFTVTDRDVTLSGLLEDGSPFSFDLNRNRPGDFFSAQATLTVTLIGFRLLGDMDCDGNVDFDDIDEFILGLSDLSEYEKQFGIPPATKGDTDGDGDLDFDDIRGFVTHLSSDTGAVPEPSTLFLLTIGSIVFWGQRWNRTVRDVRHAARVLRRLVGPV